MVNFICPVKNARLTSKFGWRVISGKREWHQGVDLASTGKVPIYASADGTVSRAQVLSSYGNVVMIKHIINGKAYETNYAHLDSYSVKVGQKVKQGQQIGIMGQTGRSYGIHLHFEIHNGYWASGQPNAVDPMKYITLTSPITSTTTTPNKGELTMTQYKELNDKIVALQKEMSNKQDKLVERKVSDSHKESWEFLKSQGITDGSNPQNFMSREQFATMLKRYHDKFIKQ